MTSKSSTTSIDSQNLCGADGLFVLVARALDRLKPGDVLEVLSIILPPATISAPGRVLRQILSSERQS
jgi:hypothetical protein